MNNQLPEKHVNNEFGVLSVHSIFYTIQGEGPFAGRPAVFVRLAGCNLQCPECDTEYTVNRYNATPIDILQGVRMLRNAACLVVITGGEPFRQNITELCKLLLANDYTVQIETNGTFPPPALSFYEWASLDFSRSDALFVVCSPKTGKINGQLAPLISAYKYVLSAGDVADDGLPEYVLEHPCSEGGVARPPEDFFGPIYLQPADYKDAQLNALNLQAVVDSCMTHGYTLQLQIHKLLGVE
jgi:organic radical activating enzyme